MKQSTKLLSLVLALVLAFSCVSVIGNAALVKSEVSYDNIDDANLTAEQVADLALDLVDNDLLAGMDTIDLSILGELRLNKIDYIFEDITGLRDSLVWSVGSGLLGDLGDLDFDPLLYEGSYGLLNSHTAYQRSHGDLNVIMALLELLGNDNNSDIISKIAYGLGTDDGISLGLIGSFLDLGSIGDLLGDIPMLIKSMAYDMLIYGSYGFDEDYEEMGNTLPASVDTLDEMAMQAITGLLVNPQNYDWVDDEKVWDTDSLLMPTVAAFGFDTVKDYFNIAGSTNDWDGDGTLDQNNVFQIIDKIAPFALYDLGIGALNNNLKKTLLEAVEVDFYEIDVATLPDAVATDFEVSAEDGEESYVTYIAYDRIMQVENDFYYTTMKTETVMVDGVAQVDEDGNEITERVRKYYKANTATANDFYDLIDFGWEFVAPEPYTDEVSSEDFSLDNLSAINYEALIAEYGSIMESLNHLLYVVFETAVKQDVKDYFAEMTGDYWVDGATTDTYADGTSIFMDNASRLLKYLLAEHADKIFGSDSPYVDWEYEDIADYDLLDIVAIIGPVLFEDVMPQLIMPKNEDGTYAFHDGVQVLEFGALVIREFMTEIAPNVNYDSYIFDGGTVTSADGRFFKEQDEDTWFNIILNIGMDIAYTYLNNITNFNTELPTQEITEDRWKGMLSAVVTWAANYVSDGTNSIIHGFEPSAIAAYDDPLDKLSYVLNTLLPLGFINGCTTDSFDFDVSVVFDKLKALLTEFDLTEVATLFGRNEDSSYNMLADVTVIDMVIKLVNRIVNLVLPISENGDGYSGLLQGEGTNSLDTMVSQDNLKVTVQQLLRALYTQGRELLNCALPVLAKFIKGWGTEQNFETPDVSLSRTIDLTNGATTETQTVSVRNGSNGVWRHYKDASGNEYTDEQYKIVLKTLNVYDGFDESGSSAYVTASMSEQTVDYGQAGSFTYTAANVGTDGALVRFKVGYQVLDESGAIMANEKLFYVEAYAWLNYNGTDEGTETYFDNDGSLTYAAIYAPHYVPLSTATDFIPEITTGKFGRDYKLFTSSQKGAITASTATIDGITFGNVEMTFANSSGGRYFNDLKQFSTYTVQATNDDGEEQSGSGNALTVSGSVNEATWTAAKKTSGSNTTFSVTLTAKGTTNGPHNFSLFYYDDENYNALTNLAASEMNAIRLASGYNLSGVVYAGSLLETENSEDENGDLVIRDTNFTGTAWVANADAGKWAGSYTGKDGTVYTETVTTYDESAVTITDEENGESGYVEVDGEQINVKKVTVIDCATAINAYVPAFLNGVRGGMQAFNANTVYDFQARYEALKVAADDVSYCRKSGVQLAREGQGDNIDGDVDDLKSSIASLEATYTDNYDYTDYKMYRLNRFNDAREDAKYYVNLKNDASNTTVAEIDEVFPYTGINEDDLRALVAGDKYEAYILALLETMDEEQIAELANWLKAKKEEYQTTSLLDVEMASNYLTLTSQRLLKRDHGVITTYLDDEITSAQNVIGTTNGGKGTTYTDRSWTKYIAAYNDALAVQANPTQKTVFDAKWELLCCRNELVAVEDEADYSELEELIAQATQALANASLYDNTNKELGQVLAELGYDTFTNADGDEVDLFPGSALYVNTEPYSVDDQDEIDEAATALKEALARLKFKGLAITGADVATEVIVPGDEEAGIEDITASVVRLAPELNAAAVKEILNATATGASVSDDLITVSNDVNYTIDTDLDAFAGTNSTVTFYTLVDGIKVPVATVKVVVNGDVNGDGVVDVIDATFTTIVSHEKGEFEGCYFIAANQDTASETITADDVSAVVNLALA